ncbi:MAG: TIGR00730 family Rossman fold protein [Ruminococcaceae bacterium]|nr:TIGR00730 family Rossman fold protein [Oscillospiraceae bacterium]
MNICVYGASSNKLDQSYISAVEEFGLQIAKRGHHLVFGGGAQGLMGATARGVHKGGGNIVGVAPSFFDVDGILYQDCTEFIYTETMRERKQIMEDRADAFVMVPGGIGTFEEFFEILTLKQLGRHQKAIACFNVNGFFDTMIAMLEEAIEGHFMAPACRELYRFFEKPEEILDYLERYEYTALSVDQAKHI